MKSINLQLEDLGAWMKLKTPLVSPARKTITTSVSPNLHKRAATSIFQEQGYESDSIHMTQEDSITRYLQEQAITRFPAIYFINNIFQKKARKKLTTNNEIYKEVKENGNYWKDPDYLNCESHHINHQYFPYRHSSLSNKNNTTDMRKTKNIFPYKLKKCKHQSCSPSTPEKNYIFWNQRKLFSNSMKPKPPDTNTLQ